MAAGRHFGKHLKLNDSEIFCPIVTKFVLGTPETQSFGIKNEILQNSRWPPRTYANL